MIHDTEKAYIAGLFDGEGSIHFKRSPEKKRSGTYNCMRISMEITMTDKSVLVWVHEILGCGTLRPKTVKGFRKDGTKYLKQWKWRATFRDAYYVCCLIWPWAHVKLPKIQQILQHYANTSLTTNVVNIEDYKLKKEIEYHGKR